MRTSKPNRIFFAFGTRLQLLCMLLFFASWNQAYLIADDSLAKAQPKWRLQGIVKDEYLQRYANRQPREFDLFIFEEGWRLRLAGIPGVNDFTDIAYSNGLCYYMNNIQSAVEKIRAEQGEAGYNIATAMIRKDIVPQFPIVPEASAVWLSFLSGSALASGTGYITPPFTYGFLGSHGMKFEEFCKQRFYSSSPTTSLNIAEHAVFTFEVEGCDIDLQLPSAINAETNCIFTLLAITNTTTGQFPSRTSLYVTGPTNHFGHVNHLGYSIEVILTNALAGGAPESVLPAMPGPTVITDMRFGFAEYPLMVVYSNVTWLDDEQVRGLQAYSSAVAGLPRPRGPLPYGVLIGTMVLVLLVPAIIAWSRSRAKRQMQMTDTTQTTQYT